jgi:hypothetical protein
MPRNIRNVQDGSVLTVHRHLMTHNFWEYYLLDNEEGDIRFALVQGQESELGNVSLTEMHPYVLSDTLEWEGIMPPIGYEWVA